MNPMLILAILMWFLTGAVIALLFGESIVAWLNGFNARYAERFSYYFRKPGKQAEPRRLRRLFLVAEIGAFLLGFLLFRNVIFSLWAVGFVFFAIYFTGRLFQSREWDRFDNQMVDVTYGMRNSLKAGMTLQQAMQMISNEFAPPASEQFRIALREIQLGASIEESLVHMAERVKNPDFDIMVNAIEILRQTGGNMIETFENITETLKTRKRVEGKIKSLTAQGRMQAIILCAMPFVMALLLYFLNRPYIEPLFTTILGNVMLTIVLLLVSTGWFVIKKIITIEV